MIYLEIKDRQSSKLQYPLTDNQLFEIVRDLAKRARTNPELKPEDLRSLIAIPGGDEANIYEELVTGGLLVPVGGNAVIERYKVEPLRLVYGFGMLLAAELEGLSSSNSSEIEEFLTSWFEPQPDMDRKVDICGSAMFHALFQDEFPESALRELVRYWLGLRNWADTAQLAFTTYVVRRPKLFLEVAEGFWSSVSDSGAAQEFLGAAFVAHRDDPRLQPALAAAIQRWMGFVHPLGRHFWTFDAARNERLRKIREGQDEQSIPPDTAEREKQDRIRQEIETRAGCPIIEGRIDVAGTELTVISDGALLGLGRFGLMVMSAGDPSPFIHALVQWGVASAVMGEGEFNDLVSWVVRLSESELDAILLEDIRRLLARNEATASEAARYLLSVIGSEESDSLIKKYELTPRWYKERRMEHAQDPCKSLYEWKESEALPCLGRDDVPLHIILGRASFRSLIQQSRYRTLWFMSQRSPAATQSSELCAASPPRSRLIIWKRYLSFCAAMHPLK